MFFGNSCINGRLRSSMLPWVNIVFEKRSFFIDDQMWFEPVKPTHRGLASLSDALKGFMLMNPAVMTSLQGRGIDITTFAKNEQMLYRNYLSHKIIQQHYGLLVFVEQLFIILEAIFSYLKFSFLMANSH